MTDTPTLTLGALKALKPCSDRYRAVRAALAQHGDQPINAQQAVEAGATLDDLVWVASAVARQEPDVERRLRLWMADCAARVAHIYERQAPTDRRVRAAIEAARAFARGEIDAAARAAARAAAWDAEDAARAAARAARAAWATARAAWATARAAAWDTARAAAWDAAGDAARAAARAARDAARAAGDAAGAAAWDAARAARDAARDAGDAAGAAARDTARDAPWAAGAAAGAAEEAWQLQRLVLWLTDEPADWPMDQREKVHVA